MRNPEQNKSRAQSKPALNHTYSKPRLTVYGHVGTLTQGGTAGTGEFVNMIGMKQMNKNRRN